MSNAAVIAEDLGCYSDSTAANYAEMRNFDPWWKHCVNYTTRKLLGDLSGLSVYDLGCGEGTTIRNMLNWGAIKCFGTDVSESMIRIAEERKTPNASYQVLDATQIDQQLCDEKFDLVATFWVVQYMASYEQLYKFIRAAYINLKPGGYFCGIVSAYDERFPLEGELKTMKAAYKRQSTAAYSPIQSWLGDAVTMTIYNIYPSEIERAFEVGFKNTKTFPMELSKEGEKYFSREEIDADMAHVYVFRTQK